jgi:hypothetical protein
VELATFLKAHRDRAAAVLFVLLGFLVLLIGWIGVSGAELAVKQIPYIMSGGIAGILFVAVGAVLWVSADLRDEWRELRKLRVHVGGLEQLLAGRDVAVPETEVRTRARSTRSTART